jgi:hypothetical protein
VSSAACMAAAIGDIVTQEYAALLREYRVLQVTGDSYAGQWVAGGANSSRCSAARRRGRWPRGPSSPRGCGALACW